MTALDVDRAYGALIGQAVGDALGAPTEGSTREEITAQHGWVDDFLTDDPVGTDDTEFSVFTAMIILRHGSALTAGAMTSEWAETVVRQQGGFYGAGFSEMTAINNLQAGLVSPESGNDNHEMWSDGSAMRITPVGVFCAGDPVEASRLAGIEARISHSRDGVYCAQAVAAAVAVAVVTDDWETVVSAGVAATPADSWSRRMITKAVEIGRRHDDLTEAVDELYARVSLFHYPWADVAPEATALAFGVFTAGRGEYVPSVLAGVNMGRDADTIAAMVGGMSGGLQGAGVVPERWRSQINTIRGHCIRATAGVNLRDLADQLVAARTQDTGRA